MRLLLASLLAASLGAADWYVAPGGSDAAAGSSAAPLATFANAVSRAHGGDSIRLQRAGTYRLAAAVTVPGGVTVTAYGSGARPVLTASRVATLAGTWSQNADVRTATLGAKALACWIDGAFAPLARYPNSGWLQCDAGSTVNRIVDAAAAHAAHRWEEGQVRWRRWSWWWETRPIDGDSGGGALDIGGTASVGDYGDEAGTSYCVDGVLAELDAQGEWYADATTLYVLPTAGATTIEAATGTYGVTGIGAVFDGVAFARFAGTALQLDDAMSTVRDCAFSEIEDTAIGVTYNAGASLITGCTFTDVRNVGVSWVGGGASGGVIERSAFTRIGMQPGYGGSGAWHANGVVLYNAASATVRLNRFTDIGYCGVIVGNDGQTVERNVFSRCLRTLNDGAAVYTNCSHTVIDRNIVLESIGDTETGQPWFPLGQGIWPEFIGPPYHDTTITGNTVYGCNGNGIFLSNHATSAISGNVCLDNRLNGILMDQAGGHAISGNVFGVLAASRRATAGENLVNAAWVQPPRCISTGDGVDYGTMSGTSFIAPAGSYLRGTTSSSATDYATVADWAAANPSWADAAADLQHRDAILLINDTETDTTIAPPSTGTWKLLGGAAAGGAVAVPAFRSVVLVSDATVAGVSPYYLKTTGGGGGGTVPGSRSLGTFPGAVSTGGGGPVTGGSGASADGGGGGGGGGCGAGGGIALLVGLGALLGLRPRRGPSAR